MLRSIAERQSHLALGESCIEIGGGSKDFRGLLAHHLKTHIMTRADNANLCHACHNPKCSNPNHLYWGTIRENSLDRYRRYNPHIFPPLTPEQSLKQRVGISNALRGKPKSEAHKKALSIARRKHAQVAQW